MLNNKICLLSDLHGKTDIIKELLEKYDYIIQGGDYDLDFSSLNQYDSSRFKINFGNHDDPNRKNYSHTLPDYGNQEFGGLKFFNIGGGFSIDWQYRVKQEELGIWPKTWFPESEELNQEQLEDMIKLYKETKPNIVISHEAPRTIANLVSSPSVLRNWGYDPDTFTTRTSEALERCYQSYHPSLWFFFHFHKKFDQYVGGCRFICQEECAYLEIDEELNITYPTNKVETQSE